MDYADRALWPEDEDCLWKARFCRAFLFLMVEVWGCTLVFRLGVLCTPEGGIIRLIPEAHLRLAALVKIRSRRIFDSGFGLAKTRD